MTEAFRQGYNDTLIKVATLSYPLGALLLGGLGAGAGALIDRKKRLRGALIGALLGAAGGVALGAGNGKKGKNERIPDDDDLENQVLEDLRVIHGFAENFAYHHKRLPNNIDEMLPGYEIGSDGYVLRQSIWDARRGGDAASTYRVRDKNSPNYGKRYSTGYRFAVVPSDKGNEDKHNMSYALLAYPENGTDESKSYVIRRGNIDLSNDFSFYRPPDIRVLTGDRVSSIDSITPEVANELDALPDSTVDLLSRMR